MLNLFCMAALVLTNIELKKRVTLVFSLALLCYTMEMMMMMTAMLKMHKELLNLSRCRGGHGRWNGIFQPLFVSLRKVIERYATHTLLLPYPFYIFVYETNFVCCWQRYLHRIFYFIT